MIPNLSLSEILIILFMVLLLFGANRVPELGKSLGEGIRNFKKALTGEEDKPKEVKAQEKRDS
ncbi:MAG: twin-arginine translocase TatA/TatE family subunit [Aquificaceae bacterium]